YIDDIVEGVIRIIEDSYVERNENKSNYKVYNIGNNNSVKLLDFIEAIESSIGKKALREYLPMQPGDVEKTWADVEDLIKDYGYSPNTSIKDGVDKFITWYKNYYNHSQ